AGSYFARVSPGFFLSPIIPYRLELTTDYAGGSLSTARDMGTVLGAQTTKDFVRSGGFDNDDFYKFTVPVGGHFTAALTAMDGIQRILPIVEFVNGADLFLINDANHDSVVDPAEIIDSSTNNAIDNELIDRNLGAGTYYLHVNADIRNGVR